MRNGDIEPPNPLVRVDGTAMENTGWITSSQVVTYPTGVPGTSSAKPLGEYLISQSSNYRYTAKGN
jgi:hypothetical protein